MIISIIVAMDQAGGIGKGGKIPWHLRADLQRFKRLTMGHHILMGRKTFTSIGRPLPGRTNILITRQTNFAEDGCQTARSLAQALAIAQAQGEEEAFVIGGGEIFTQALPMADRIYLTRVHVDAGCDVFFPPLDLSEWAELFCSDQLADENNQYPFSYHYLVRRSSQDH
ncbi:MAG: dihydrofolate reductase [Anaerolineales bacterium]|nr:dihydrofolate reductase [Anaerolineales bacterium]